MTEKSKNLTKKIVLSGILLVLGYLSADFIFNVLIK